MSDVVPAPTRLEGEPHPVRAQPRGVRAYVLLVTTLALLGVVATAPRLVLGWPRTREGLLFLLLVGASAAAAFLLHRHALVLHWRGQRNVSSFDEPVAFLSLALLPPGSLVAIALLAMASFQVAARRGPFKATFNVSVYVVAATVASGAAWLLGAWVHPLGAAAAGLLLYTGTSNLLVAGLFARLGDAPLARVFRDRFLLATLLHVALGATLGVAMVALWSFHPLAVLTVLPFLLLAVSYVRMNARSEQEILAHRSLAEMTLALAGTREVATVAERVLDTCGSLLLAGRATLTLQPRAAGEPPPTWSRDFEGGPAPGGTPLVAPVRGKDGRALGELAVSPSRRVRDRHSRLEPHLLTVIAGQAASAIENAWSLEEIAALKELHEGIVEHVPAGVVRLDARGRPVQMNALLAKAIEGSDGTPFAEWPAFDAGLRGALAGLREGRAFSATELSHGGRTWLVAGVPLGAHGRHGQGAVVLFHDVTELRESEDARRAQSITRPLVRRIVLNLVGGFNATRFAISDMGRSLAKEVDGKDVETFTASFRAMGLGELAFERRDGAGYRFVGDDLLERRASSVQPTCHLAVGFLEGAVASLHGGGALGSEVACQSQGYKRCVFVVMPRGRDVGPTAQGPR